MQEVVTQFGSLLGLQLQPHDLILVTDVDELVTAAALEEAARTLWAIDLIPGNETVPMVYLAMGLYYYNLHHKVVRVYVPVWLCAWAEGAPSPGCSGEASLAGGELWQCCRADLEALLWGVWCVECMQNEGMPAVWHPVLCLVCSSMFSLTRIGERVSFCKLKCTPVHQAQCQLILRVLFAAAQLVGQGAAGPIRHHGALHILGHSEARGLQA